MQIKYLKNYVLLSLPEKGERHEEGNSQITEDMILVAEYLRRSVNSNQLLWKSNQIKGRETFSLTDTMQTIYRKFCLTFSDIIYHSAGGDHTMSSSDIHVPMPASRQQIHEGDRLQSTAKLLTWINLDEWRNHSGHSGRAFTQFELIRHIIGKLILSVWRKLRAVNGLLEGHAVVPVHNTVMVRGISCYHDCCYEGGGYFTHTATGEELSVSKSSGISWRKIHMKQAPAMAVVTNLNNSLKRSGGVSYRRVKLCWLTHCWIDHMFSSYHAFVEYVYSWQV